MWQDFGSVETKFWGLYLFLYKTGQAPYLNFNLKYVKHIIFEQNFTSQLFQMQCDKNLDFFEHNFDVLAYSWHKWTSTLAYFNLKSVKHIIFGQNFTSRLFLMQFDKNLERSPLNGHWEGFVIIPQPCGHWHKDSFWFLADSWQRNGRVPAKQFFMST